MIHPVTYDSLGTGGNLQLAPSPPRPEIDRQALDANGFLVPHYRSFQSLYNLFSKTYSYRWDEAVRHGLEDAKAMRNDTYFRALLQERLIPLGLWEWTIEPDRDPLNPKAPHSEDRARVALMLEAEAKACPSLMKFRRHMGWCAWFGRIANQVLYRPNPDLPWNPMTVQAWEPVDGDKLQYSPAGMLGDLGHWCVWINPTHRKDYPPEETAVDDRTTLLRLRRPDYRQRFVIGVHEIEDAPYEEYLSAGRSKGIGLRDFLFWGWWLRDELLSWLVNIAEKAGTLGILCFKYPAGNEAAKKQAEQNAREVNNRSAIAIPVHPGTTADDYGVEVIAIPTAGLEFIKGIVFDIFDKYHERLIVGQSLSAGTEGHGLGGSGVADMHEDTKFNLLKFDALNQAEYLTSDYVRVLQRLNRPDDRWAYRWKYLLPDPKAAEKLEAITKAASLPGKKLTYKADEIRDLVGVSKPDDGDEIVGGDDQPAPGDQPQPGPEQPGMSDDDVRSSLGDLLGEVNKAFGAELFKPTGPPPQQPTTPYHWLPVPYLAGEWQAHQLAVGPRKGQTVYKNARTGEVRDTAPGERQPGAQPPTAPQRPVGGTKPAPQPMPIPADDGTAQQLAAEFPQEAADPATWGKVTAKLGAVKDAVYGWMIRHQFALADKLGTVLETVFDTPGDMAKFGYAPVSSGPTATGDQLAGQDPLRAHLGISTHLALTLATKVMAAAYTYVKNRLAGQPQNPAAYAAELAPLVAAILAR